MQPQGTRTSSPGTPSRPDAPDRAVRASWLLVMECDRLEAGGCFHSLDDVDELRIGRGVTRRFWTSESSGKRVLYMEVPDARMSTRHACVLRRPGGWMLEDRGSTNGSRRNGTGVAQCSLDDGDVVQLGHTFFLHREGHDSSALESYEETARMRADLPGLATLSSSYASSLGRLMQVAPSDTPVLIRGETGTHKDLLASAVHALSRRPGPLVTVRCCDIPEADVEGHLFGRVRGGDDVGLVRMAHTGTLFLDEMGDLSASSQAVLFRALQQQEVLPVGAVRPIPVDIRVVSATHLPIEALIARGTFRQDLALRIAGFVHDASPLRQRPEDIGILTTASLRRSGHPQVRLRPSVAEAFLRYDWPLNVRELEQCLASACLLADDDLLRPSHLPPPIARMLDVQPPHNGPSLAPNSIPPPRNLSIDEETLRAELVMRLAEAAGNVSVVAQDMGKARQQIQRWLRRFKIDPDEYT